MLEGGAGSSMATIFGFKVILRIQINISQVVLFIVFFRYTSNFLRENALYHPIDKTHPSPSGLSQLVNNVLSKRFDPLNGSLISIVDSRLRIDEKRVLGTCYWEDAAQEPVCLSDHFFFSSQYLVF